MAIAIVGDAVKMESGSGTSVNGAVSATAGNALIAGGAMFNSGSWAVTRTGDTYTTDTNGANGTIGVGIASAPNVAGGSVTMTVTCSAANGVTAYAVQLSGLPTSAIRDANSPAVNGSGGTPILTNSLTNVTANAIYFACAAPGTGVNPTTITPLGGWSDQAGTVTMYESNDATVMAVDVSYLIVASTASRTESWTCDVGASNWASAIAVYKAAAGGAQDTPELRGRPYGLRGGAQMAQLLAQ